MSTPTPSAEDHKKDSAKWAAFQKAFAAAATLPAIVAVTHTLLKSSVWWVGIVSTFGISLFAAASLVATGKGLRSELLAVDYPHKEAVVWSWILIGGGVVAMFIAAAFPF